QRTYEKLRFKSWTHSDLSYRTTIVAPTSQQARPLAQQPFREQHREDEPEHQGLVPKRERRAWLIEGDARAIRDAIHKFTGVIERKVFAGRFGGRLAEVGFVEPGVFEF